MEVLRAKSSEKKEIFRKLFNTEIYDEILDELKRRKNAKEKELAFLTKEIQMEVSRVCVDETFEKKSDYDEYESRSRVARRPIWKSISRCFHRCVPMM